MRLTRFLCLMMIIKCSRIIKVVKHINDNDNNDEKITIVIIIIAETINKMSFHFKLNCHQIGFMENDSSYLIMD